MPWDQHTLNGYIYEIGFVITVGAAYLLTNGALLLFFISMCWHHQAFSKIVRHFLCKSDHSNGKRNDKEFLCEIIRFHVSIKEYVLFFIPTVVSIRICFLNECFLFSFFLASAGVYSPLIACQLMSSTIFMACVILHLDLVSDKQKN